MKIRTGFVSNSSSSSFLLFNQSGPRPLWWRFLVKLNSSLILGISVLSHFFGLHPPRSSGGRIYTICKKRNTCRFGSFGIGLHYVAYIQCRVYASDRGQGIYDTLCIAVQEGDFQAEARDKPAVAFCSIRKNLKCPIDRNRGVRNA